MPIEIENMIQNFNDFPTLPTIYSSLLEVMSKPFSTIQDISEVIAKDMSVTAKIIKMANSPIFALNIRVETLTQAIFLIGFTEVKNIVLAISVLNVMKGTHSNSNFNFVNLWKHSIAVGVIARILGNKMNIRNLENYFVAGLMHDIGKLVLYKIYDEEYSKGLKDAIAKQITARQAEKEHFGFSHEFAGEIIANKWKFPDVLIDVIKYHHNFQKNYANNTLLACVHLANIIANSSCMGHSGTAIIEEPDYEIWSILNYEKGTISNLIDEVYDSYRKSIDILRL